MVQWSDNHMCATSVAGQGADEPKAIVVPFTLPGLTQPLNFVPGPERIQQSTWDEKRQDHVPTIVIPAAGSGRDLFPCALYSRPDMDDFVRFPLTTLRELSMMRFMNEITDKAQWHVKIMDDNIAKKWKDEAINQQQPTDFTERMATFAVDELHWRAKAFESTGFVFVFNGDVVKSDTAISNELKGRLQDAVAKLEAVESKRKDYHPYSDDKVWNLVHPSLFPLVYGTSRILRDRVIGLEDCLEEIGSGEVAPVPSKDDTNAWPQERHPFDRPEALYSQRFQWLPCDVRFTTTLGNKSNSSSRSIQCTITSYINNMHPTRHCDLYHVLEEVLAATIPLWNETLLTHQRVAQRIEYNEVEYDRDPEDTLRDEMKLDNEELFDYLDSEEGEEKLEAVKRQCLVYPEPDDFESPEPVPASTSLVERYANSGLQVIVKLATIELSPEKPNYDGGTWHVEGQLNEHICATALYYYSCDNITESRLGFRQMCEMDNIPMSEQDDHTFLDAVFGCQNDEAGVQDVGSVWCKEGRLLTFPNALQHRVLPFELADKTKPGHRKILALFLVDPNLHIISTSSVPPQRMDWYKKDAYPDKSERGDSQNVASVTDFPLSIEQAKTFRLELMKERKVFELRHADEFESVRFSLCEH